MATVRIQGVYRNYRCEADNGQKVFFVCELNKDGHIAEGEWPGMMVDEGRFWPMLLSRENEEAGIRFSDGTVYQTNFGLKAVRPQELFTVGDEWIYQIYSCHQYESVRNERGMIRVKAICIDQTRLESHEVVLWCLLDRSDNILSGQFFGYCEDDNIKTPIIVNIGINSEVDYGDDYREPINLSSGRVGEIFTITSADSHNRPDVFTYKIIGASLC